MHHFRKVFSIVITLIIYIQVAAQSEVIDTVKQDTSSISHALLHGTFTGQIRYAFMATNNKSPLSDYYANALGASIKYETLPIKGFSVAIAASDVVNAGSGNLSKVDSVTGKPNRYEAGLFDLNNLQQKHIPRIEELYVQYQFAKGITKLGRQRINTPLINPQDGRMRPTFVNAFWTKLSIRKTVIEGGGSRQYYLEVLLNGSRLQGQSVSILRG